MELEVGSYFGLMNTERGVYIAPNDRHCFAGSEHNLFLVIDLVKSTSSDEGLKSNILNLSPSTKKLIQFTHDYLMHDERDAFTESLIQPLLCHVAAHSLAPDLDSVVMNAKHWIDNNCTDSIDVSKVARHCHLSISQLQRRFKRVVGCGIAEFWALKKLNHAKLLLTHSFASIESIAFQVGYEHLSAFSRRFSQAFGASPSQWRKKALMAKKMRDLDK
jgi:AraC-like DNA-binding protein